MEFEKLALEVRAHFAGLSVIEPPFVVGSSGVRHRFTFLASRDSELFAIDICEKVGVVELIRTFAKSLDTGVKACIINLGGGVDSETLQLARASTGWTYSALGEYRISSGGKRFGFRTSAYDCVDLSCRMPSK